MLLQTLMVSVLAPAATAGAISSEREHQTLELLAVTPISSLAIVLGKLLSALAWVFVLVLASIPITALVFVFGGVAPDDVLRGYAVLFATVIGLGSVGIFFSALTRRTGASTGLTFVMTLVLMIGSLFLFVFLTSTAETSSNGLRKPPSEAILYLNPFVAQADVACGTEDGGVRRLVQLHVRHPRAGRPAHPARRDREAGPGLRDRWGSPRRAGRRSTTERECRRSGSATPGQTRTSMIAAVADPFRDRFWPKTVIAFLVLAAVLTTASIQFVSPNAPMASQPAGSAAPPIRRRSAT